MIFLFSSRKERKERKKLTSFEKNENDKKQGFFSFSFNFSFAPNSGSAV